MKQYKIEVYKYTEKGSLGGLFTTRETDSPIEAEDICYEYDSQRQESGMKAYDTKLFLQCYKECEDKSAFFANFHA